MNFAYCIAIITFGTTALSCAWICINAAVSLRYGLIESVESGMA